MSYLTLHHFGLPDNTFNKHLATTDLANVGIVVKGALANRGICSIVGPSCVGKSMAVAAALPKNVQLVEPQQSDKERMRIGTVEDELVCNLSNEVPKRTASARSRQLRPILGDAAKSGPVVLVIEESHRLHYTTLLSLKTIHELKWAGRTGLLTIILIGERDPLAVPALRPLALRTESLVMTGPTVAEATLYIKGTVGPVWDKLAIAAAAKAEFSRNYHDLKRGLVSCMKQALAEGRKQVQVADVFQATGTGLKELLEINNISQAQIAKAIGMDKSSVSRIISGERPVPEDKKAVLDAMLQQRYQEAAGTVGVGAIPAPVQPSHGSHVSAWEPQAAQAVGGN